MSDISISMEGFFDPKPMTVPELLKKVERDFDKKLLTKEQYDELLAKINYEAQKYNDCLKALIRFRDEYAHTRCSSHFYDRQKAIILSVIRNNCKLLQKYLGNIVVKGSEVTKNEMKQFHQYLHGLRKIILKKQSKAIESVIDNGELFKEGLTMADEIKNEDKDVLDKDFDFSFESASADVEDKKEADKKDDSEFSFESFMQGLNENDKEDDPDNDEDDKALADLEASLESLNDDDDEADIKVTPEDAETSDSKDETSEDDDDDDDEVDEKDLESFESSLQDDLDIETDLDDDDFDIDKDLEKALDD